MQSYQGYGYPAGQGQPQAYGQPPIPGVDDYDASYYQGGQAYQFAQSSAPPSVESTRNQDFSGYYGQSQGSTRNQDFSGYYGQSQGSYPNQPTIPAGYIFNPRDGYYYRDRSLTDYGQLQQIPPLPTTPFRPPPPPPSEVGTEEEEEARLGSSFNHRLQLLQSIRPNSVKSSSAKKKILTDAEEASGCSVTQENCSFTLKESEVVGHELALVQASSRGEDEDSLETEVSQNHTSKSGSTFPKALALGKFCKPRRPPYLEKKLEFKKIPKLSMAASSDDKLLGTASMIRISDSTMSQWEETSRRGLASLSVLDRFLGGIVGSILTKGEDGEVQVRDDVDPESIQALVDTASKNLRFSAHAMATTHTNCVLARREALLWKAPFGEDTKTSLRSLPPGESLLSGQVNSAITNQANLARDMAFQSSVFQPASFQSAKFLPTHKKGKKRSATQGPSATPAKAAKPNISQPHSGSKFKPKKSGGGRGGHRGSASFSKPHPQ